MFIIQPMVSSVMKNVIMLLQRKNGRIKSLLPEINCVLKCNERDICTWSV